MGRAITPAGLCRSAAERVQKDGGEGGGGFLETFKKGELGAAAAAAARVDGLIIKSPDANHSATLSQPISLDATICDSAHGKFTPLSPFPSGNKSGL